MIFVDDILTYFRGLGHAAEYGTLAQLNEQLTNVDYAASTDGMVAFVRLIGEQRTVDGHDQCDIAVHLSWLCPLDFDGETILSTQEQAKDTLKAWINHLRGGNTVTVSEDARWQFGYDDFAENVAWVAVRLTLTAAAADCVPLSPEPPTPPTPPTYQYNVFCPQILGLGTPGQGSPNPCYLSARSQYKVTMALTQRSIKYPNITWVGDEQVSVYQTQVNAEITEANIQSWKIGIVMTAETEQWLRERIGMKLVTMSASNIPAGKEYMLVSSSATWYESKAITVI